MTDPDGALIIEQADRLEKLASVVSDPAMSDGYRQVAAALRATVTRSSEDLETEAESMLDKAAQLDHTEIILADGYRGRAHALLTEALAARNRRN